jgi:hypothetical protein
MKKNYFISCIVLLTLMLVYSKVSFGQLEKVIVERYYVSDANDATDTYGGGLPEGSVTYRVYVDLAPGTVLKGIFGDALHPFTISSNEVFFNNVVDGQSFAKDFIRNRYLENTVALDTWITIGQTAKQGPNSYYGILKEQDTDGSFVGGLNNDGGSEAIGTGLLINNDPTCGLALTVADGMDTLATAPTNWFNNGILDFMSGNDSTMFGSIVPSSSFASESFSLSCSGVMGVVPDSNQIIIAQLTTKGELTFQLNIEVEYMIDGVLTNIHYVGTNEISNENEVYNPYLSYPFSCGCNDPNYLEFDPGVICNEEGSCATPIVLGCMDTLACNFDPLVNMNVAALCCYPGWCSNRNIEEVCPQLKGNSFDFSLYPNPTAGNLNLNVITGVSSHVEYIIYNSYGVEMIRNSVANPPLNYSKEIDLSAISPGIYQLKVITSLGEQHKLFVKL